MVVVSVVVVSVVTGYVHYGGKAVVSLPLDTCYSTVSEMFLHIIA